MALFLFFLEKAALAYLPTVHFVALRPPSLFGQVQYAQVFLLKPALFCTLIAGLGSLNKFAISHLFSSYLTLVLSSPPFLLYFSFYINLSSWKDGERYLCPLQSLVVSLLLSLVFTFLFSRTGGVLSSKFFDLQVPSVSNEKLVLPCHACCAFSRLPCNGNSLLLNSYTRVSLGLAESRILWAAPADIRLRTLFISFSTVQLWILCTARYLETLCLSIASSPGPKELPDFWGSMVFCHAIIPRKVSGNNNNKIEQLYLFMITIHVYSTNENGLLYLKTVLLI